MGWSLLVVFVGESLAKAPPDDGEALLLLSRSL